MRAAPGVVAAEVAGPGFINLRLADAAWRDELRAIAAAGSIGTALGGAMLGRFARGLLGGLLR